MTKEGEIELIKLGGLIAGGLFDMFKQHGLNEQAAAAQTLQNTLAADADWDQLKADHPIVTNTAPTSEPHD